MDINENMYSMIRKFTFAYLLFTFSVVGICQSLNPEQNETSTIVKSAVVHQVEVEDSIFLISILDNDYGLILYADLNFRLGGDSLRHDKKGYAARGWIEDYYPSGKLLHRGYYSDGFLKVYKNYFPNGITERSYKTIDHKGSTMERFYQDGRLRSMVQYKGGIPIRGEDYYPSGQMEYIEEFHKTLDFFLVRKSFYTNGQIKESLLLIKEPNRLYDHRKYNDTGILLESGKTVYSEIIYDYQKIGKWIFYDNFGKPIKEKIYENGRMIKTKSF